MFSCWGTARDDLQPRGQHSDTPIHIRVARLLSPQHGCWKWEQYLQPNMSVNHHVTLPRKHWDTITLSTLRPFAHGLASSRCQRAEELIFSACNLWIHLSPTSYLFLLIDPRGLTMALAGHQCWSFIPLHTGLVLTPLAKFTDLTDCGLNAACLVFSTCPSRFATLAAQFPPILIIHQLVMPAPGRLS